MADSKQSRGFMWLMLAFVLVLAVGIFFLTLGLLGFAPSSGLYII